MALGLALAAALPARAEVQVVTQPDGRRVVRNVGGAAHHDAAARRGSAAARQRAASQPELAAVIAEHATAHGVDPRLVEAVIQAESAWNRRATSRAGAVGLMQLMPDTAVGLAVDDPTDAAENVRGGVTYLARQLDRFGSPELALAAYNAGPQAVERYDGIPPYPETREYVRRVLSLYRGRAVSAEELAPFQGRASDGDPAAGTGGAPRRAGTAPSFVRRGDGRLVLTNTRTRAAAGSRVAADTAPAG